MANATHDDNGGEGAEFIHKDDGSITARDIETKIASFGEMKSEAFRMLSGAFLLHEGGGEPVTDEDLEELGLDTNEFNDRELPDFM